MSTAALPPLPPPPTTAQRDVVAQLSCAAARVEAQVEQLARRYPEAFPPGSSLSARMASGKRVTAFPATRPARHAEPMHELEDAMKAFEETNGVSLLRYTVPSAALVGREGDGLGEDGLDHDVDFLVSSFPATIGGAHAGSREGDDLLDGLGMLPITAALLAARRTPMFDKATLTRKQVHDVLTLQRLQERHEARVASLQQQLSQVADRLEALLDGREFRECLEEHLETLAPVSDSRDEGDAVFAVSGEHEGRVWQRWVAPSVASSNDANMMTRKTREEVVALSLVNARRLRELLARLDLVKQQHAALVSKANEAAYKLSAALSARGL